MTSTHCQICGRKKHLTKKGAIVFHFTRGDRCPGGGFPPIEIDDARLTTYAAELEQLAGAAAQRVRDLEERRANWIDPALISRRNQLWTDQYAVDRRLRRIQTWVARYRRAYDRQMMQHGYCWAIQPPAYLVTRAEAVA